MNDHVIYILTMVDAVSDPTYAGYTLNELMDRLMAMLPFVTSFFTPLMLIVFLEYIPDQQYNEDRIEAKCNLLYHGVRDVCGREKCIIGAVSLRGVNVTIDTGESIELCEEYVMNNSTYCYYRAVDNDTCIEYDGVLELKDLTVSRALIVVFTVASLPVIALSVILVLIAAHLVQIARIRRRPAPKAPNLNLVEHSVAPPAYDRTM